MNAQITGQTIETPRLRLRRWLLADIAPYAAINSDPQVMQTLLSTLTLEQTQAEIAMYEDNFERLGYGVWAVELRETREFIGAVGLEPYNYPAMVVVSTVAISWKLAREFWGKGLAQEAANAALDFAYHVLGIKDVVALIEKTNTRSVRLMRRLNMQWSDGDEFARMSASRQVVSVA